MSAVRLLFGVAASPLSQAGVTVLAAVGGAVVVGTVVLPALAALDRRVVAEAP
jgi:hypothetical protein